MLPNLISKQTLMGVLLWMVITLRLTAQSPSAERWLQQIDRFYYDNLQQARLYADSASRASDTAQWTSVQKARFYLLISRLDYADGDYPAAFKQATQASEIAYAIADTALLSECYLQFGDIYIEKGYLDKSIEYQQKAVDYWERRADPNALANSYHRLGLSYFYLREWETVNTLFDKAIAKAEQHEGKHDWLMLMFLYFDKGKVFHFREEFEEAKHWFDKGLLLAQQMNNKRGIALGLRALGALHLRQEQFDSAQWYYTQASQHFLEINDQLQRARTLQGLGEVAIGIEDYTNALAHLDKALMIARAIRAKLLARDIYADYYRLYSQQQDYQQALLYYRKFTILKDSISSQERTERIAEIEVKYETEKLAREKLELTEKNRSQAYALQIQQQQLDIQALANRQKYWVILGLIGVVALLGIISWLVIRQNRLKAKVRENELQEQALKAQMNPHFIFNSLNSVQSLIATGDGAGASVYLARFAKLMRMILHNSRRSFGSLKEEIAFLGLYVELEQRRFQQAFDYTITCEEELESESPWVQIPTFVIQPFIENAIAHGLLKKSGGGQLSIQFEWLSDTELRCVVEDNGIGRSAAQAAKSPTSGHESVGISITEQRLRRLLGLRPSAASPIQIIDLYDSQSGAAAGTRVEIVLPARIIPAQASPNA